MKILTLCSNPFVSLEPVTQLLEVAGLPEGLNSLKENQSYDQWHEQVFDAYEQDCSGLHMSQPLKPGKVWQDMAGQLIQANLSKKQWYWSDSRAGWLLDFWLEIEPQHRFALIYSPPQIGISQCLLQVDEQNASIEIAIKSWINYHFELLRFYRRHQDKCILVNLQRCLAYPSEFIQICRQHLGFDIDEQVSLESVQALNESFGIEELLFQLVAKQYPEINNLFQELEASATPFVSQVDAQSDTQVNGNEQLINICQDYRNLNVQLVNDAKVKIQLQHELETHKLAIEKLATEKAQEIAFLHATIKKLEETKVILEKQKKQEIGVLQLSIKNSEEVKRALEEQAQSLIDEVKQCKQKISESEQSNELVLLQLHQVQEELESAFLKAQKLEREKSQEISALHVSIKKSEDATAILGKQKEKEKKTFQAALKSSEEAKGVLEKQKQTLNKEVKQYKQKNAEHEEENGLMLLQLSQVREEFEAFFQKTQKLESEQAEEKQALQNEIKQSKQNTAEIVQENDLILLQLHQVQEELETAFLKAQKLESDKAQETATIQASIKESDEAKLALEKQAQTLKDEVTQCKEKSTEYEKENRLMFLRLHQVQDELENYFEKYQKLERNMQSNNVIACIEQQQGDVATSSVHAQFIQVKNEAEGFGVDLINLQWQDQIWPKYHLQIIKPTFIDEKIVTPAAIKLPLQINNLLPLKTWPPQTANEQGAYWMIDESLLSIEQVHSHFYPEDIAFLYALACQLPEWLKILESSTGITNDQWDDYYQVIEGLQPSIKGIFKLQES